MLVNVAVSQSDGLILAVDESRHAMLREPFQIVQLPYTTVYSLGDSYGMYVVDVSESGQVSIRRAPPSLLESRATKESNDLQQFLLEYILDLETRLSEAELGLPKGGGFR